MKIQNAVNEQYRELLIGSGYNEKKIVKYKDTPLKFLNLITLDKNVRVDPDYVHDLRIHPLPFKDNWFNEIHAYDILEHLAYQGDEEFFFKEFIEYYRILKPKGLFVATVPSVSSKWTIGDPGHKRIIIREQLLYLNQEFYQQCGKTQCSDYRDFYKANFVLLSDNTVQDKYMFVLEAKK